jgi:hypothetical protein
MPMTQRNIASFIAALLAPALALADPPASDQPAPAVPAPAAVQESAEPAWSGWVHADEEYRYRNSSGDNANEQDHLGRLIFDGDLHSPSEAFNFHGSAALWLRGGDEAVAGQPFGLSSVRDESFWLDVYQLWADWSPHGVIHDIRLGRMETEHGQPGTFDGLSITLHPTEILKIFAFGGRTVHFYELQQGIFEDWMGSVGLELRGDRWRIELDYRFLKEDVQCSNGQDAACPADTATSVAKISLQNHSYGITGWYRQGDWLNVKVQLRGIDQQISQVGAALRAEWVAQQLGLDAKVDVQPATLGELNELDSPFYLTLGESLPHVRARLDGFKGFAAGAAGDYAIHLGGDFRQLLSGDEGPFNRNLTRGYLLFSAAKIGGTGLFASLVGEIDRVDGGKGLWTVGGALGWDHKPLRVEVGSDFQRYQYIYYLSPEELTDVREFYGDIRVRLLSWLTARARYSYEIFDRRLHTVTVSLAQAY